MSEVNALLEKYWDKIVQHRRHIHANPEPSHQEKETAAYIASVLREIGIEPRENVGGYGVTAVIEGKEPGKCVALRADFDALEITEKTGVAFASTRPGVMHACGHDVHTAMLLGVAQILFDMKNSFNGSVKLIFQPAEEDSIDSGAKAMIKDGCLENPHVDSIYALHVWPGVQTGQIAIRNGIMMGASDRFFMTVHGKASHGGRPNEGIDAIVIASQIVTALQTIVSRNFGPLSGALISIGKMYGGTRYNIVADKVVLEGTCRNVDLHVRAEMPKRIFSIAQGIAESMGGSCDIDYRVCYAPTVNAPEAFEVMRNSIVETLGDDGLVIPEQCALTGEDFSYYGEKIPAGFGWLGCNNADNPCGALHASDFLPDENAMIPGVKFLVNTALNYLGQP